MSHHKIAVVIPWRDRGLDPRRAANLQIVVEWWWAHGLTPFLQSDGLSDDAPFNRHRAYNAAVSRNPDVDMFVFTEADMLLPADQIAAAVTAAENKVGLVVPFTEYRYLSDQTTCEFRDFWHDAGTDVLAEWISNENTFKIEPESTMDNGKSIGAVNVVSRETLDIAGGFTEATSGNWYDDRITEEGFAFLTNTRTRYISGPAVHMYHLPGWTGDHLTDEDKAATARNKELLIGMRENISRRNYAGVRNLLSYREVMA